MNDIIQADYEALEKIAARFGDESERVGEVNGRIQSSMRSLQNGGWVGEGANAFFDEMEGVVTPGVTRLTEALAQAQTVTLEVKHIIQEAEEEAARPFGGQAADGLPGGATDASADANTGSDTQTASPIGPDGLFSTEYMDNMVGRNIRGAGDPRLINAMSTLSGNPTPAQVNNALDQIAAARGVPRSEIQASYDRYLELRAEADRIGASRGKDAWEALNESRHPDFMGSTTQLRYGQTVGDALGIDPVFGSLLNPTGGLVGPGNNAFQFSTEHPVGYHGIFHDAAGYLYNYHNQGPGYNYMGLEPTRNQGDPFTGQQTGIAYWNNKMGADGLGAVVSNGLGSAMGGWVDIKTWTGNSVDAVKRGVGVVVDTVQEAANDIQEGFGNFLEWAF